MSGTKVSNLPLLLYQELLIFNLDPCPSLAVLGGTHPVVNSLLFHQLHNVLEVSIVPKASNNNTAVNLHQSVKVLVWVAAALLVWVCTVPTGEFRIEGKAIENPLGKRIFKVFEL